MGNAAKRWACLNGDAGRGPPEDAVIGDIPGYGVADAAAIVAAAAAADATAQSSKSLIGKAGGPGSNIIRPDTPASGSSGSASAERRPAPQWVPMPGGGSATSADQVQLIRNDLALVRQLVNLYMVPQGAPETTPAAPQQQQLEPQYQLAPAAQLRHLTPPEQPAHSSAVAAPHSVSSDGQPPPPPAARAPAAPALGVEAWRHFTPYRLNPSLCSARTWADGRGDQCKRRRAAGSDFCSGHASKRLTLGRVDGPIPEEGLRQFQSRKRRPDALVAALTANRPTLAAKACLHEHPDSATSTATVTRASAGAERPSARKASGSPPRKVPRTDAAACATAPAADSGAVASGASKKAKLKPQMSDPDMAMNVALDVPVADWRQCPDVLRIVGSGMEELDGEYIMLPVPSGGKPAYQKAPLPADNRQHSFLYHTQGSWRLGPRLASESATASVPAVAGLPVPTEPYPHCWSVSRKDHAAERVLGMRVIGGMSRLKGSATSSRSHVEDILPWRAST